MDHRTIVSFFTCQLVWVNRYSWVCYFRALKIGDASKVAPVDKFSLVLVAIFSVLFLKEHPSVREWCGIAMISGGVVLLALKF